MNVLIRDVSEIAPGNRPKLLDCLQIGTLCSRTRPRTVANSAVGATGSEMRQNLATNARCRNTCTVTGDIGGGSCFHFDFVHPSGTDTIQMFGMT